MKLDIKKKLAYCEACGKWVKLEYNNDDFLCAICKLVLLSIKDAQSSNNG